VGGQARHECAGVADQPQDAPCHPKRDQALIAIYYYFVFIALACLSPFLLLKKKARAGLAQTIANKGQMLSVGGPGRVLVNAPHLPSSRV
jgi:hypothetical protein